MSKAKTRTNATRSGGKRKPRVKAQTWQDVFLLEFRKRGNVRDACKAAQVDRSAAYRAREGDPLFAAAWKLAKDDATDALRREAWRRAVEGVKEPIYFKGEKIDTMLRYSDGLLTLLLKAHAPDEFSERTRGENLNLDLSALNDRQLELLANGANIVTVLAAASHSGTGTAEAPAE